MAFTSRAPRNLGVNGDKVAVGPGSYDPDLSQAGGGASMHGRRVNAAPFLSGSARPLGPDVNFVTPGPGTYRASTAQPRSSATSVAFRSRTTRDGALGRAKSDAPGPGQYDLTLPWKKRVRRQRRRSEGRKKAAAIQWAGTSNVPSIPAGERRYGYAENDEGELVPQRAPDVQSEPLQLEDRLSAGGTAWAKSRGKRVDVAVASEGPGPGTYTVPGMSTEAVARKALPSSAFKSSSSRWAHSASDTPGPGTYQPPAWRPADPADGSRVQCFGSTSQRMADLRASEEPGPGAYFQSRPYLAAARGGDLVAAGGQQHRAGGAPFLSTSSRFEGFSSRGSDAPGPGAYVQSASVSEELNRRRFGRNASFGSTVRRFDDPAARNEAWKLGPGAHSPEGAQPPARRPSAPARPSAAFASQARRFAPRASGSGPAPGDYNAVAPVWKTQKVSRRGILASGEPRFRNQSNNDDAPGPGAYGADIVAAPSSPGGAGAAFRSAAPRLGKARLSDAPGPGTYDPASGTLNKPSFNVTVGPDYV